MNDGWLAPGADTIKCSFNKRFNFSALSVQGGHEFDCIRCGFPEAPRAGLEFAPGEGCASISPVFNGAFFKRAIDELASIEKHILALKSLVFEFHSATCKGQNNHP